MPVENSFDVGARKVVEDTANVAKQLSSALLSASVMDSVGRSNLQIKRMPVTDIEKNDCSFCFLFFCFVMILGIYFFTLLIRLLERVPILRLS